jgi:high-affinity iron transporter
MGLVTDTAIAYFCYSFGILFREGLEAILVIVALAAGTRAMASSSRTRDIYGGALLAVAGSIALAWGVNHVITDNMSDTLEGVFQFLAAATLFYVSSWLTSKAQADRWIKFISHKVETAERSRVPAFALGLTAFLAVMREGAETIVFFQALSAGATVPSEHRAVMAGIAAGAVALAAIFVVFTRAAHRLPVGRFFAATSILLYGLAVVFVGQGVASWQEAGVIGATFVEHVPTVAVLGLYPTLQSIGAQLVLMVVAAAALVVPRGQTGRVKVSEPAAPAAPRPT